MAAHIQKSITLEARVDIRQLATLYNFYMTNGITIVSKSALIAQVVNDMTYLLVTNEKASLVSSVAEAVEILKDTLKVKVDRTQPKLLQALQLESLSSALGEQAEAPALINDDPKQELDVLKKRVAQAMKFIRKDEVERATLSEKQEEGSGI